MGWDKNDYMAAAFLLTIFIISTLAAMWILGAFPGQRINTVFPFR